jgi:hypothetical protein
MTRRRFVGILAAGSAAIVATGAAAPATGRRKRPAAAAGAELAPLDRKELERQRASTISTLEVIRKHSMPPGTELASVFKPLRSRRTGR